MVLRYTASRPEQGVTVGWDVCLGLLAMGGAPRRGKAPAKNICGAYVTPSQMGQHPHLLTVARFGRGWLGAILRYLQILDGNLQTCP